MLPDPAESGAMSRAAPERRRRFATFSASNAVSLSDPVRASPGVCASCAARLTETSAAPNAPISPSAASAANLARITNGPNALLVAASSVSVAPASARARSDPRASELNAPLSANDAACSARQSARTAAGHAPAAAASAPSPRLHAATAASRSADPGVAFASARASERPPCARPEEDCSACWSELLSPEGPPGVSGLLSRLAPGVAGSFAKAALSNCSSEPDAVPSTSVTTRAHTRLSAAAACQLPPDSEAGTLPASAWGSPGVFWGCPGVCPDWGAGSLSGEARARRMRRT
mmetsp:Transcript_21326/g.50593  ORF Transcript_21326/g.50593 Transcript_21326/m.50593 type:complete len:292 (-) Transcript_21326:44-919(-)